MSKGSAIIAILIALVGGFAIGHLTGKSSGGETAETDEVGEGEEGAIERYKVPVSKDQPSKGPADALVTIVEVSDFECPFCKRVLPTVSQLMNEYKGKIRLVWRNNPLPMHPNAGPAAQAAMEAYAQGGAKKFWQMHDLLFENQQALTRPDLEKYAQKVGLDMGRFKKALDSNAHSAKIRADQMMSGSMGAMGTPAFFINGRKLMGAQPYGQFKEVVEDEIRRAEALVKTGVAKSKVYQEITKNALTEAKNERPNEPPKPTQQPDPNAVYKVPVGNEPQMGPADALVTIVEFSDFECPFCKRVGPTIKEIEKKYGKDVRVVWMNNPLPFHQQGLPSAQAAMEAFAQGGAKKFWKMHDLLFENQQALTRPDLEKYAKQVGLDMNRFKKALDSDAHKDLVTKQQNLARSIGATSVPNFFINGRNIRGAQPTEVFTALIDEELAKAKKLVEEGTARKDVYAKIIANGATAPKFVGAPSEPAKPDEPPADQVYKISVPASAPKKGGKNAKVVIQEFSDFQCPFCSRVGPTLEQVMKEYGDKVQIVWRNYPLPFHQNAPLAHQAAMEVNRQGGSKKFWAYHDLLFANQQALSRADLENYAEKVGGINMGEFRKALDSNRHKPVLDGDMDAIQKAGAQIGTPSFFINGKLLQGAQPYEAFKAAIDEALKKG